MFVTISNCINKSVYGDHHISTILDEYSYENYGHCDIFMDSLFLLKCERASMIVIGDSETLLSTYTSGKNLLLRPTWEYNAMIKDYYT